MLYLIALGGLYSDRARVVKNGSLDAYGGSVPRPGWLQNPSDQVKKI